MICRKATGKIQIVFKKPAEVMGSGRISHLARDVGSRTHWIDHPLCNNNKAHCGQKSVAVSGCFLKADSLSFYQIDIRYQQNTGAMSVFHSNHSQTVIHQVMKTMVLWAYSLTRLINKTTRPGQASIVRGRYGWYSSWNTVRFEKVAVNERYVIFIKYEGFYIFLPEQFNHF